MREKQQSCKGFVTRQKVQLFTVKTAVAGKRYATVVYRNCRSRLILHRLKLNRPRWLVTREIVSCRPLTLSQRGEHDINQELLFSNHTGYIFHDSRGIESGGTEELEILREFIQRKTSERRLNSRLHAIWFGFFYVNDDN